MINDTYKSNMRATLARAAGAPKNDPMPLVPLIAAGTSHIGVIATVTTSFYPPFLAARLGTTLDHLTEGRVGFNLVTASGHRAAQNYGLDQHIEHDKRYRMADEWMRVVSALWESWELDAVVADCESGVVWMEAAYTTTLGRTLRSSSAGAFGCSRLADRVAKRAREPKMAALAFAAVRNQSSRVRFRPAITTWTGVVALAARSNAIRAANAPVPKSKILAGTVAIPP